MGRPVRWALGREGVCRVDRRSTSTRREIDDETIRRADLYIVHSKEVARLDQSPDIFEVAQKGIKAWDSIHEIQDLLAGKVAGRTRADQITVFNNNTGAGTQFAALGSAVLKPNWVWGRSDGVVPEDVSP
jgi:ornithine cyclodeaminase/alanine dehydrogenase-like protein (mu-crystallin family)